MCEDRILNPDARPIVNVAPPRAPRVVYHAIEQDPRKMKVDRVKRRHVPEARIAFEIEQIEVTGDQRRPGGRTSLFPIFLHGEVS